MGYQPDIKASGDEKLLINLNRHSDNYSTCDLTEETRLLTARIGYLLEHVDRTDEITIDTSWEKIQKVITLKCKLVETQARLTMAITSFSEMQRINEERIRDLRHKQKMAEHKSNAIPLGNFNDAIAKVSEILFKYIPMDVMPEVLTEFEGVLSGLSENVKEFKPPD